MLPLCRFLTPGAGRGPEVLGQPLRRPVGRRRRASRRGGTASGPFGAAAGRIVAREPELRRGGGGQDDDGCPRSCYWRPGGLTGAPGRRTASGTTGRPPRRARRRTAARPRRRGKGTSRPRTSRPIPRPTACRTSGAPARPWRGLGRPQRGPPGPSSTPTTWMQGMRRIPEGKGTESSHSAAATEVKFEGPFPRTMHPTPPRPCRARCTGATTRCCSRGSPRGWPPARLATSCFFESRPEARPHHIAGNLENFVTSLACSASRRLWSRRPWPSLCAGQRALAYRAPPRRKRWTQDRGRG